MRCDLTPGVISPEYHESALAGRKDLPAVQTPLSDRQRKAAKGHQGPGRPARQMPAAEAIADLETSLPIAALSMQNDGRLRQAGIYSLKNLSETI